MAVTTAWMCVVGGLSLQCERRQLSGVVTVVVRPPLLAAVAASTPGPGAFHPRGLTISEAFATPASPCVFEPGDDAIGFHRTVRVHDFSYPARPERCWRPRQRSSRRLPLFPVITYAILRVMQLHN